jgi:hypothetical protein
VNAAEDLRMAAKLDFDEEINELLHEIEPKVSFLHFPSLLVSTGRSHT